MHSVLAIDTTNASGGPLAYSGVIGNFRSGSGTTRNDVGLAKLGSGTLALSGNNTYSGATTVFGGTLAFVQTNSMSVSGAVTVNSGATLAIYARGAGEWTTGASGGGSIGGLIAGTGGQGTVDQITWNSASSLGIDASNAPGNSLTYSGSIGNFRSGSGTTRNDVGLTKLGSGTLTLTGSNSYSGLTAITGGTLSGDTIRNSGLSSSFGSGSGFSISNGATLEFSGFAGTNRTISLGSGGGTIAVLGIDGLFINGVVSGAGGLTKTGPGPLSLNASNSYAGTTVITGGALAGNTIANSGSNSSFGSGSSFSISDGATLEYTGSTTSTDRTLSLGSGGGRIAVNGAATNLTWAGTISGAGGLTKSGFGTLALSGTNTYTGGTTIVDGKLRLNGSVTGPVAIMNLGTLSGTGTIFGNVSGTGRLAPGNSPGIITINGNYTQSASGTLEIEFGGTTPGTQHDKVTVSGAASLAGRLEVPLINSYVPPVGTEIEFLTAATGVSGQFNALVAPNLEAINLTNNTNLAFLAVYGSNNVRLRVVEKNGDVLFSSVSQQAEWSTAGTWSTAQPPDFQNVVDMANLYNGGLQTVTVSSADAKVHQLTLMDNVDPITINVQNGKALSAQTEIAIGANGSLELQAGSTVNAADISIQSGGLLAGDGAVKANSLVNSGGTLRPGFSVGNLVLEGSYEQTAGGTLLIDIESASSFDFIDMTGSAMLGGALQINASNLTTVTPGTLFPILTADNITGSFDNVESTGNNNVYFIATTDSSGAGASAGSGQSIDGATVYVEILDRGDMNGDAIIDSNDFDLFAFGLMNRSTSKFFAKCDCDILPQQGGDFSGNGRLDFDDIAGFQNRMSGMGMSSDGLMAAIDRYLSPVPEPSSGILILLGSGFLALVHSRRSLGTISRKTVPFSLDVC